MFLGDTFIQVTLIQTNKTNEVLGIFLRDTYK